MRFKCLLCDVAGGSKSAEHLFTKMLLKKHVQEKHPFDKLTPQGRISQPFQKLAKNKLLVFHTLVDDELFFACLEKTDDGAVSFHVTCVLPNYEKYAYEVLLLPSGSDEELFSIESDWFGQYDVGIVPSEPSASDLKGKLLKAKERLEDVNEKSSLGFVITEKYLPYSISIPLQQLACHNCEESMYSPTSILIDSDGHSICDDCQRSNPEKLGPRNVALEKLAAYTRRPCRFMWIGCKRLLRLDEADEHEEDCKYSRYKNCPFELCYSNGPIADVVKHIKEQHKVADWTSDTKLTVVKQSVIPDSKLRYLINSKGDVLMIKIFIQGEYICFVATHVNSDDDDEPKYCFQLECVRGPDNLMKLMLDIPCYPTKSWEDQVHCYNVSTFTTFGNNEREVFFKVALVENSNQNFRCGSNTIVLKL